MGLIILALIAAVFCTECHRSEVKQQEYNVCMSKTPDAKCQELLK